MLGIVFELAAFAIGICIMLAVAFVLVVQGEEEDPLNGLPGRAPSLMTTAQEATEWGKNVKKAVDAVFYAQGSCRDANWWARVAMMDIIRAAFADVDRFVRAKTGNEERGQELERVLREYRRRVAESVQTWVGTCPSNTKIRLQNGKEIGAGNADAWAQQSVVELISQYASGVGSKSRSVSSA